MTAARHRRGERRPGALRFTAPVALTAGALCASWSLLLAGDHASPAPGMGGGVDPGGCVRIAVPVAQYWAAYGGLCAVVLALCLYGRRWRRDRRERAERRDPVLAAGPLVIGAVFGLLALFAAYVVTMQGLAIEGGADYLCAVSRVG